MTWDLSANAAPTIGRPAKPAEAHVPTGRMFTAGAGGAPVPSALPDEFRTGVDRESTEKPADVGTNDTAPIDMFLLRQLRETQRTVSRLIEGYLAFDEIHRKCERARSLCEDAPGNPRDLRAAVGEVNEANSERPDFADLEPILVEPVRTALSDGLAATDTTLDKLRRAFLDTRNPIYMQLPPERVHEFAAFIAQLLSELLDQITDLRGLCRKTGLDELKKVTEFVESIFYSTEQARDEARANAAAARRQAFEGPAQAAPPAKPVAAAFRRGGGGTAGFAFDNPRSAALQGAEQGGLQP
jgi:hypothetical protein